MHTSPAAECLDRLRGSGVVSALACTYGRGTIASLAVLSALHISLLLYGALRHSPAYDEVAYLPAGISNWQFGRFELYAANPPLVRMLAAVPVLFLNPVTDWTPYKTGQSDRPEFEVGKAFVRANGERSFVLYSVARVACIPLSLLAGYICFRWARFLYGTRAGLFAATMWCFSPTVLASGQMITPDMGAAAFGVLALYVFRGWCSNPTWGAVAASGVMLGIAELAKTTWLIAAMIWPLAWLIFVVSDFMAGRRRAVYREILQLLCIVTIAIWVLNMGYGCDGTFRRLKTFTFASKALTKTSVDGRPLIAENRFAGAWLGEVPVPLPLQYVLGIDTQKCVFENPSPSYLRGEFRVGGWWYYFFYAALIKAPLGTLGLILVAVILTFRQRGIAQVREELIVLLPVLTILLASVGTPLNRHFRYLLILVPFLFVWLSKVANTLTWDRRRAGIIVGLLAGWSISSSLILYPHSLSYFNELVGGPSGGPAHLVDSNIDWGQDYLYFREWMAKHPEAAPMNVEFFGCFGPADLGDQFGQPPLGPSTTYAGDPSTSANLGPLPGWYAISATFLKGAWSVDTSNPEQPHLNKLTHTYFNHFESVATAGYSIYIYHLEQEEVNRVRVMLGLPQLTADQSAPAD